MTLTVLTVVGAPRSTPDGPAGTIAGAPVEAGDDAAVGVGVPYGTDKRGAGEAGAEGENVSDAAGE